MSQNSHYQSSLRTHGEHWVHNIFHSWNCAGDTVRSSDPRGPSWQAHHANVLQGTLRRCDRQRWMLRSILVNRGSWPIPTKHQDTHHRCIPEIDGFPETFTVSDKLSMHRFPKSWDSSWNTTTYVLGDAISSSVALPWIIIIHVAIQ